MLRSITKRWFRRCWDAGEGRAGIVNTVYVLRAGSAADSFYVQELLLSFLLQRIYR